MQNRLQAFANAQQVCKGLLLSDPEAASSLVRATKSSVSSICECAAMLTVARKSDDQIAVLAAGDRNVAEQMARDVGRFTVECVHMH
jgi:hypothetical protein